jgi:GH15 family glucan-1,4-alpha-glucosidase
VDGPGSGRRRRDEEPHEPQSFAPHVLREYALLADGERGVLIGPRGDFAWMCFPRWDSEGLFSSLIGGAGVYAITPVGRCVWGGYYEEGTLIWRSRWITDSGAIIESREALALPAEGERAIVLRQVHARAGRARVHVLLNPRGAFGSSPLKYVSRDERGRWHGRIGEVHLSWAGAADAADTADGHGGRQLTLELDLAAGDSHDLVLALATSSNAAEAPDAAAAWSGTEAHWRARVPTLAQTIAPRDARHACSILTGLTSSGGGMVAAATMSLPERARQGRNYDYRYVWIRDQCYAGQAAAKAGIDGLLDAAVAFTAARLLEHGPDLKPAYTTTGGRVPDQRQLDLPGYPGGADVVGNWVNEQFQLDAFGETLLLFAAAAERDRLDADGWHAAEIAAETIERRWREPDAGIWEIEPDAWTHSRLICAAGLRAAAAHAARHEPQAHWLALADAITADTAANALHPSGRWQRSARDERLDAALLLPAVRGALAADDPRTTSTLHAYARELTQDGYAYRYRPDERPLGESEGAFLLCGFMLALAYAQQGDSVAAARWFERNRAACGPPGLLSEEFDVAQRQLRGNLPQAFVHALLLECAGELMATCG